MSDALQVGQRAPDFSLRDQHGRHNTLSSLLSSSVDTRAVLVVFYPFAFSRVCSGELTALQGGLGGLRAQGARVVAISCDPMFTLRAYAESLVIDVPLLSDFWPHGAVASAYGVFDSQRGCSRRSSFVIDTGGLVRWAVHSSEPEARSWADYAEAVAGL